jgi:spermidine synthase
VVLACLLSGAASLAYEVLWGRSLVTSLGNTADASAAVLTAFVGAMGLGAALIGRLGDRVRDPLLLYSSLECALAVFGMAVPVVGSRLLPRVAAALLVSGPAPAGWMIRLLLGVTLVAVPAALMGATLPLLVRRLSSRRGDAARWFSWLYAANTAGAAFGAAAAGLFVVPMLGIRLGSGIAAVLNLAAAALGMWARRLAPPVETAPAPTPAAAPQGVRNRATLLAAVSGALLLFMERLWSRMLVLVLGHDTYGFSSMLVAVIVGLALGGVVAGSLGRRRDAALGWASVMLLAGAALSLACFVLSTWLVRRGGGDPFGILAAAELDTRAGWAIWHPLALSAVTVLVPAAGAGAVFPLCCAAVDPNPSHAGGEVGRLTAANAVGAVIGGLLPTLGVVGWIGVHGSVTAAGGAAAVVAVVMLVGARAATGLAPRILAAVSVAAVAAASLAAPSGGMRRIVHVMVGGDVERITYHAEGRTATVTVTRNRIDGTRQLFVNAVNEVTTRYVHDQSFSLLGHLGLLLHPDPREVLVVCHGAGLTPGAAARHRGAEVTVVDLEKKVIEASRLFADLNGNLHENENVDVLVEDGRNHLLATSRSYDVITVDSTHPRAVDSWVLYTVEFYELARRRLSHDGILVQWVPLHGMSAREFRILTGTFLSVFPQAQLWANVGYDRVGFTGYALLVAGRSGRLAIDADRIDERMDRQPVAEEMARWGMDGPADVLDCFIAGPGTLASWTADEPLNTDDRPLTPFVTGYSRGPRMGPEVLAQVVEPLGDLLVVPSDPQLAERLEHELGRYRLAEKLLLRGEQDRAASVVPGSRKLARYVEELAAAREYRRRRAARDPDDPRVLLEAGSELTALGGASAAVPILERAAAASGPDPRPWFHLGLAEARRGRWEQAERAQRRALELDPDGVLARINLALAVMALGDPYAATEILRAAARADPGFGRTWVHLGEAHLARGEPEVALEHVERALRLTPTDAQAHHLAGRALGRLGDGREAIAAYDRAIDLDPGWFAPRYDRALELLAAGDYEDARRGFEEALELRPESAEAWTDLGLALAGTDRWAEAAEAHLRATDLDPELARAWLNLGLALKALGETTAAESAFRRALVLDPEITGR